MNDTATTASPTRSIGIGGLNFIVDQPFKEGHQLTTGEASAMNQLYEENIRNNLRNTVEKAKEEGKTEEEIQTTIVDPYCDKYEFGQRKGSRREADPVKREMRNIAIEAVKPAVAKAGYAWTTLSSEQKEAAIQKYLNMHGVKIEEIAKTRLAALAGATAEEFTL